MTAISARPEVKIKILAQTRPGPKEKLKLWPETDPARNRKKKKFLGQKFFFPDFGPYHLDLSDFLNRFIQLLVNNKRIFFADDLVF